MKIYKKISRVALLSIHTSPLDQPGIGDAGGMNVYLRELSKHLAQIGVEVDIFTRATSTKQAPYVQLFPGVKVRHLFTKPLQSLSKENLAGQLCGLSSQMLQLGEQFSSNYYDLVHSHYWLSGQVGQLLAQRWQIPLVHNMHTMAKVKNLNIADNDLSEPSLRVFGEQQLSQVAKRLIVNTTTEASQLEQLYGVTENRIDVVSPGVDLEVFSPGSKVLSRKKLGITENAKVILFVGRVQLLKGVELLLRAVAVLVQRYKNIRHNFNLVIVGGVSGTLDFDVLGFAAKLGISDLVRLESPVSGHKLAQWYRSADLLVMPSYSESFGLVAIEAQAVGVPVLASNVGGLVFAVADKHSGMLVAGHDAERWAGEIAQLVFSPKKLEFLASNAREHAQNFRWETTANLTLKSYKKAIL